MNKQLVKFLRDTLNNLYDPEFLRRSPLARMLGVAGRNDTPTALQRCLENEILTLKPQPGSAPYVQNRRSYDLIQYRYIEQFSQKEVADHMGISLRQYQREQQQALELLASVLEEKFHLTPDVIPSASEDEIDTPTDVNGFLEIDNSWLFVPSEDKSSELLPILQDVILLLQPLIIRHKVEVKYEVPDNLPVLSVHPVALRQILVYLLNEAIHESSCRIITLYAQLANWEVTLELEGKNCASSTGRQTEYGNPGVKIARQLTRLSGGVLSVSQDTLSFDARLELPARESLPILVIDDSLDNIKLLQRYFLGTRYLMVALTDPELTLETAEEIQPGLIVLDLMMPRIDGWELLGKLRNHFPTSHIPILIFSILPLDELAISLGADAFLRKPVTREKFLAVLDHHVSDSAPESD